jgi:hypothetical protein
MRVYLASTADEVDEFLQSKSLEINEVYAPTPIYSANYPDMDEEEIEYTLSLLAAEDSLDLLDDQSGAPLVIAFEVPDSMLGAFDKFSVDLTAPLHWDMVEAVFLVGDDPEDLTWFAPQEVPNQIEQWLNR